MTPWRAFLAATLAAPWLAVAGSQMPARPYDGPAIPVAALRVPHAQTVYRWDEPLAKAAAVPDASLVVCPGGGHFAGFMLASEVLDWIDSEWTQALPAAR